MISYQQSVAAERSAPVDAPSLSLVPCALRAALLARHRELRAAPRAQTALALPLARPETVAAQLALRCAREMSLPDSCADLLLAENDEQDREGAWSECEEGQQREAASSRPREPCCRSSSAGLSSAGSLSSAEHQLINDCVGGKSWRRATVEPRPPAAAAVPDVALAPNANTHLLCPPQHSFSGMGVLQLDLGDGATHTPRPGSRALRAASQHARHRDHTQQLTMARSRVLPDDDDLRAAIEMSVMRAYSSMAPAVARTLPHRHATHRVPPRRLSPSPSARSRREHDHMDLRAIEACQLDGASPVPRRHYRLEPGSYGGSSHSSRGPSPSDYA
ncbi:hypothetical protein JYU34_008325 [Plutella xylostella]|uniref:Uncharacterized protein n=2 Tax=Plutella xylostella TaxID=51655 RepID=A0ABQ7QP79_PLUXY|nr:hypothetical protein JYU34_008325 [Plutella xylostella]